MWKRVKKWLNKKWETWWENESIAFSYEEGLTMEQKKEQIRRRKMNKNDGKKP